MTRDDFYDRRIWKTRPQHVYKQRELWFPLSEAVEYWEDEFHQLMLHDYIRMDAFQRAIYQVVPHILSKSSGTSPVRILDIGAGYGILSYWAVDAARKYQNQCHRRKKQVPAIRVYAVEANSIVASEASRRLDARGMLWKGRAQGGECVILTSPSFRLSSSFDENRALLDIFDPGLFEKEPPIKRFKAFDLILTETLGSIGDNEDIVGVLQDAITNYLKSNGLVIPARVKSFLVPVGAFSPSQGRRPRVTEAPAAAIHQSVADGVFKRISTHYELRKQKREGPFDMLYDVIIPKDDYLSQPRLVREWVFNDKQENISTLKKVYAEPIKFEVTTPGYFCGFKGFFKATLVEAGVGGEKVCVAAHENEPTCAHEK